MSPSASPQSAVFDPEKRFGDSYSQPEAPDPVLDTDLVLELVHRHVPSAQAVTGIDESGGEARTYAVDDEIVFKVQRPQQLRPRTSLKKEVFFLEQLEKVPGVNVPRVLGYGREGEQVEYSVLTRMPGIAMRHIELKADQHDAVLAQLGATLRRIHDVAQEPFHESGLLPTDESFEIVLQRFAHYFNSMAARIRERNLPWTLDLTPERVSEIAVAALPPSDECVALHSNPGPEHTFVYQETGAYSGLIDFGDAFISHPTLDLRRRSNVRDRDAIMRGYTSEGSTTNTFNATWRVVQILSDVIDIAAYPDRAQAASDDLVKLLRQL